jgi:hypothetical protein
VSTFSNRRPWSGLSKIVLTTLLFSLLATTIQRCVVLLIATSASPEKKLPKKSPDRRNFLTVQVFHMGRDLFPLMGNSADGNSVQVSLREPSIGLDAFSSVNLWLTKAACKTNHRQTELAISGKRFAPIHIAERGGVKENGNVNANAPVRYLLTRDRQAVICVISAAVDMSPVIVITRNTATSYSDHHS